ncbi:MAG: type II toxin-antitoxin system RelE/ParE family toxin [Pyrinomonadaceae bacterium]
MRVRLNREVYSDIRSIMEYYVRETDLRIATDFYKEFRRCIRVISQSPQAYPVLRNDVRRMNLRRFSYHIMYQIIDQESVKVLVVKHNRRNPEFGSERK